MKKTNFTLVKSIGTLLSCLFVLALGNLQAQCTLACNNAVNVSVSADPTLNSTCDVAIGADMILENYETALMNCTPTGADGEFTLTVMDGPMVIAEDTSVLVIPGAAYELNEAYQIKVTAGGNTCWGTVTIEDKAPPQFLAGSCPDVTIDCTEDLDDVAIPMATDNCSGVFEGQQIDESTDTSDNCTTGVTVMRSFVAVDDEGNVSEACTQTITITRVTGVDFPEDIAFYCADVTARPALTAPTELTCMNLMPNPEFGGVLDATAAPAACLATTGAGMPDIAEGIFCNYAVSNDDDTVVTCDAGTNTFKIIRVWSVLDWCTNTIITFNDADNDGVQDAGEEDNVQVIKVIDNVAPVISFAVSVVDPIDVSANQPASGVQECRSRALLPIGTATDECSTATVQVFTPVGPANIVNGFPQIPTPGLPIGPATITYVATDGCGNTSEVAIAVNVVDNITPTPVCDEITQISIGGSGTATVLAGTFDDGSNDNCGIDDLLVRRITAPATSFGPSVGFTCADIPGPVDVVLRVVDFEGNFNDCNVQVLVQDPLGPFLVSGLTPDTITCDEFFDNIQPALDVATTNGDGNPAIFTQFGNPTFSDNCGATVVPSFVVDVDNCGEGTITRNFIASDVAGNLTTSASQVITVNTVNDWEILFPADVDLICTPDMDELDGENLGEPAIFNDDCEMIAISVDDEIFDTVEDACYSVLRTYTAINWCVFDGDNQNDNVTVGTTGRRFRDPLNGDGIIAYQQVIMVSDDVAPVITNPGTQDFVINGATDADGDCDRNITLPTLSVSDCSDDITVITSVAGLGVGTTFQNVPVGTYTVTATALDGCGNQATIQYIAVVRDGKAPTPYCVGGLVVELMPIDNDGDGSPDEGMVEIWANDFDAGSFDNCTDEADLKFFGSVGTDNFAFATADLNFTCDDVGNNDIFIYVQDEAGNIDQCLTTVEIESVDNVCGGTIDESPEISGAIHAENDAAIDGVNIEINGMNGMNTTTQNGGTYQLNVTEGSDVTVIPTYETAYDEGVTTYDLLLIRKHILTTELLDSPYKMIAADANNSGSITAADLVTLRTVILGMSETFVNNTSWVFVDAGYTFPTDWTLTDGYPAVINVNNIDTDTAADFMAVKVGDVNGSYTGFNGEADERNTNTLKINAQDSELTAGETVTVDFAAENAALLGYQFTLNFAGVEVVAIDGKTEEFGIFDNAITTSALLEGNRDRLFSVTFKALTDVKISEALSLTSEITKAEAYNTNGETLNVDLAFTSTTNDFVLYQNTPNPVRTGSTVIAFEMPAAGAATLTVSDISGKVVSVQNGNFAKGYNELTLNDLNAPGMYTYTFAGEGFTATRKLVVQ